MGKPFLGCLCNFLFLQTAEEGFLDGNKRHPVTENACGVLRKELARIGPMQRSIAVTSQCNELGYQAIHVVPDFFRYDATIRQSSPAAAPCQA